jgi:hypothetical protein
VRAGRAGTVRMAVLLPARGNLGSASEVLIRSADDVYPDTATLSFRSAVYHSAQRTLLTTELTDNAGHPLQPQPM